MSERSLTQMNTSGEDVTPELDQTEDEDENLNEILQKISECKTFEENFLQVFLRFFSLFFTERTRRSTFASLVIEIGIENKRNFSNDRFINDNAFR